MPWMVLGRLALRAANRAYVRKQMMRDLNSRPQAPQAHPVSEALERVRQGELEAINAKLNAETSRMVCADCGQPNYMVRENRSGGVRNSWYLKFTFDEDNNKVYRCPSGQHGLPTVPPIDTSL